MEEAPYLVFDRALIAKRRDRVARNFAENSYLFENIGGQLIDRLKDIRREFPRALNLGAHDGALSKQLLGQNGIRQIINLERSPALAKISNAIIAEEELLPFHGPVFDLIVSNLALHWVNDLPGALIQAKAALKPDGLFLASMTGGDTLMELRQCLMEAEMELTGGLSSHLSPLTTIKDAGSLLQRAGFALPVIDRETITVTYSTPLKLLTDLRAMGATHAPFKSNRNPLRRDVLAAALAKYQQNFADPDGRIRATFEIIYLSAWAPHAGQQQPSRRGSGEIGLAEGLSRAHTLK